MPVTRSTASDRAEVRTVRPFGAQRFSRAPEFVSMVAASILIAAGLWLTYRAKTASPPPVPVLNLNEVDRREKLLPALGIFRSAADRQYAVRKIYEFIADRGGSIPNVGALGRIRVRQTEVLAVPRLEELRERAREARARSAADPEATIALLTPSQVAALKPSLVVRNSETYRNQLLLWSALYGLALWCVHGYWRIRG